MRNDVKLGFAIGGVLLAVVIVFALVNSGTPADQPADPAAQVEPSGAAPVVALSQQTPAGTTPTAAGSTGPVTPSSGAGTTVADSTTATLTTPAEPFARSSTPDATATDPWRDALSTGKLPTMMNNQTTGASTASTTRPSGAIGTGTNNNVLVPRKPITAPAPSDTTVGGATSNTPAALGGGVNERGSSTARVNLTPNPQQPDSDRIVREATQSRSAGTSLSTPAKTVLTARTYTVKSGETFSTIASSSYGHIRFAKLIAKANPGVDSSRLKIGQVINLPAYDAGTEAVATAKANTPATIDSARQYRVQSGDSLHSIAVKLYSDPRKVDAIYDANKTTIGTDRAKLKPGMVLNLPAQPAVAKK